MSQISDASDKYIANVMADKGKYFDIDDAKLIMSMLSDAYRQGAYFMEDKLLISRRK